MSLRRAASLGAVQTGVSLVCGFVSVKITSVFLGPAGLGLLSQLTYFMALTQGVVISGLNTGVVRRLAAEQGDEPRRRRLISTVLRLVLGAGVPVAVAIALASSWVSRTLLHDDRLLIPVLVFAATYVFGLLGSFIVACANGHKDYRATALAGIGSTLASLGLLALLCPTLGIPGGLLAAAMVPLATGGTAWMLARRRPWWPSKPLAHGFATYEARAAVAFVPLAMVTAVSAPLIQLLVRSVLADHSGMQAVGLLQGVMRLSDMYLNIVTGVLAMYYLPRFSEIRVAVELRRELGKGLLLIVPAVGLVSLTLYLLRDLVIRLIFTESFMPMQDLFAWQMTGNVFKIVGWLFGYLLMAKVNPLVMAGYELAAGLLWWQAASALVATHGAVGATQAYALTYAVYAAASGLGVVWLLKRMGNAGIEGTRHE